MYTCNIGRMWEELAERNIFVKVQYSILRSGNKMQNIMG